MSAPVVRPASVADTAAIAALIDEAAQRGLLLPRGQDDVLEHLQEFVVAEAEGELIGTGALHVYAEDLAEIRSLVVRPAARGVGVGRALVAALEARAETLGVTRLFALTYETGFFSRLGYREMPKEALPHKIWTVCVHCARFPRCDEIAMLKRLAASRSNARRAA